MRCSESAKRRYAEAAPAAKALPIVAVGESSRAEGDGRCQPSSLTNGEAGLDNPSGIDGTRDDLNRTASGTRPTDDDLGPVGEWLYLGESGSESEKPT